MGATQSLALEAMVVPTLSFAKKSDLRLAGSEPWH